MFKRPCCLLAIAILLIQLVLVGWFQISRDLKPSYLEQNYLESENVIIKGNVYDVDKRTSYSVYYLKDIQVYRKSTWVKINHERVLVNVKDSDSIMVGNIIQAAGKIYFFQENRNPGNFNQKFYYQKQHIHAQIWSTQIQINNQKTDLLKENLFEIRESIKNMLLHNLGKDAGNSMAAILLGDKKDLDQTTKQLYQKGGIGHILAISGVKTLKLDIPLVPETRINWAFVPLHIAIIYILKLCLDEEIIPRCRFPCSRGYHNKYINWQKKQ